MTEVARVVPQGKLLCNVAEHHNLEDYLQHVRATADELREQLQLKRVSSNASVCSRQHHLPRCVGAKSFPVSPKWWLSAI